MIERRSFWYDRETSFKYIIVILRLIKAKKMLIYKGTKKINPFSTEYLCPLAVNKHSFDKMNSLNK